MAHLKVACCQIQKLCFQTWFRAILRTERGVLGGPPSLGEPLLDMVTPAFAKQADFQKCKSFDVAQKMHFFNLMRGALMPKVNSQAIHQVRGVAVCHFNALEFSNFRKSHASI